MTTEVIGGTTLILGDCMSIIPTLEAGIASCSVTSPPYFGLRDYGLTPSIWGGDQACKHEWTVHIQPAANGIIHERGMQGETLSGASATRKIKKSHLCKCGAWLGQLGLEPTVDMFVANLVTVFRQVRRVLRDDGTAWVNLGDSYAGGGKRSGGIKRKDLIGVPWRFAFAMQNDGWYLRSDVIWSKPNGMTECVDDRPTKTHEYVFLFSKRPSYYYDKNSRRAASRSVLDVPAVPYNESHPATFPPALIEPCIVASSPAGGLVFDPFIGSGTTAEVATLLGRNCIGCEASSEYFQQAICRTRIAVENTAMPLFETEAKFDQATML